MKKQKGTVEKVNTAFKAFFKKRGIPAPEVSSTTPEPQDRTNRIFDGMTPHKGMQE